MLKENGRLKPSDKGEKAYRAGKEYECSHCGYTRTITNAEFGDARCPRCSQGHMIEKPYPVS